MVKIQDHFKSAKMGRKLNSEDQSQAPLLSIPTFETSHFILRSLKAEDYDALYLAASDPKIWEQHPANDRHTAKGFLNFWQTIFAYPGSMAIIDRKSNEIIGTSSFYDYSPEKKEVTIGYTFLSRAYWGGHFNFEIKKVMIEYAFSFADKVNFHVGSQNLRSRMALKKIGAVQIAEFEKKQSVGPAMINVVYQIDKLRW
ncbi:MAG: GNAT family N-acetyltransferase [Pseudobdellovibrionaceae bacterium]